MNSRNRDTQVLPATSEQMSEVQKLIQSAFFSQEELRELSLRFCSDMVSAQMIIERAHHLKRVRGFFADLVKELSNPNDYADQVVNSLYQYYSGYREASPVHEQIAILRQHDWGREVDWSLNLLQQQLLSQSVPEGCEGYFVVVYHPTMIKSFMDDPLVDQSEPVTRVLRMLYKQRNKLVVNYRDGELGHKYYRRSFTSAMKMKQLWESQGRPTGILVLPAQLGVEHRGKSVQRARVVMRSSEFPLDAYECLQMILTHKKRLQNFEDLWINFPGGEYAPAADGEFLGNLCLMLDGAYLSLIYQMAEDVLERYGSASGFLLTS